MKRGVRRREDNDGVGWSGRNDRPLKACGFTEFSRRVASTCPAPSDRQAGLVEEATSNRWGRSQIISNRI
jgi:hypothetical protein